MKRKIFRITPEDESDLKLMLQFVIKHHNLSPNLPTGEKDQQPNESSLLRALIRLGHEISLKAVSSKLSPTAVIPELPGVEEIMRRLYNDGHFEEG